MFMDKALVCLTVPGLPPSAMCDPEFVANLPTGCRGAFKSIAEYLVWEASRSIFTAFKPAKPEERVYFIGPEGGPIKIGITTNVGQRLESLQTGSPVKLKVHAVARAGRSLERAYHRYFDERRLSGEWFELNKDLEAEIAFWRRHSGAHCGHNFGHTGGPA